MNIHLPAILMWTTGVQGFDTLPHFLTSAFGAFGAFGQESLPVFKVLSCPEYRLYSLSSKILKTCHPFYSQLN